MCVKEPRDEIVQHIWRSESLALIEWEVAGWRGAERGSR